MVRGLVRCCAGIAMMLLLASGATAPAHAETPSPTPSATATTGATTDAAPDNTNLYLALGAAGAVAVVAGGLVFLRRS